ncbi:MMPL family transporter [Streptomyces sp. AK02-01A]|uniref:MMPL family transporter n=1 Tax=Streptomyces sp. AK02-01A TaxID=3028648 RepID=UPI0029B4B8F7|nr:MMPL family transporter [Streptomyces sp. AK02-01A]MDX3853084.1 MMPL family transporter [Streptomyces sp. AK02-01A]
MAEGLIARMGHWCFRRRWQVLLIWAAAVAVGVLSAGPVFSAIAGGGGSSSMESVQAGAVLDKGSDHGGVVIGVIDGADAAAPAVRQDVRSLAGTLKRVDGVASVVTPYDTGLPEAETAMLTAKDGAGLLVQITLSKLDDEAEATAVEALTGTLHGFAATLVDSGQTGARVTVGGEPALEKQFTEQASKDLNGAESLSLPVTLVVLVFIFGGVIAAGLPVLGAVVSIASSMTILLLITRFTSITSDAVTVVTLLGMGLSIDYGLLLVARYREELGAGFPPEAALSRSWATAGRTIAFSALTVAAALTGLLMFGIPELAALGAAGVAIALASMLVALTLTAALVGFARNRIKPAKRRTRRGGAWRRKPRAEAGAPGPDERAASAETGVFAGLARRVQRRPLTTMLVTAVALVAASLPVLSMSMHLNDTGALPRTLESVRVSDQLADRFDLPTVPTITVVAKTDAAALDDWARRWTDTPGVTRVYPAQKAGPGLATVGIDTTGDPEGATARDLVHTIRADRPDGGQSWVTGDAAGLDDVLQQITDRLPLAIAVTLFAMVVLLFAMTGSVVVPLTAVAMNTLSLGAAFGLLSLVFQHGLLADPLGLLTVDGFSPFTVVSVLAFAFGLSMDYEVFLLGRIKEYVAEGLETDVAVRRGLQHSGRIITSAGLLMVIVFACFITGRMGSVQQLGLGLATAVAIDATVVRCVLVPAVMTLLGRANWWAPAPLKRLHRHIGLNETVLPEPAPAAAPAQARTRVWAGPEAQVPTPVQVPVPAGAEPLPVHRSRHPEPRRFTATPVLAERRAVTEVRAETSAVAPAQTEVRHRRASVGIAYLWWFLLGLFGAHYFYLGRTGRGVLYLCTAGLLGMGWLIDPFILPSQVRKTNLDQREN